MSAPGARLAVLASVFLDVDLPNAATWFYLSLMFAVALFFQFTRPLAVRNVDLLALYLFPPGFLLLQEANRGGDPVVVERERFAGYAWLLAAGGFWFVRCLIDLAVVKRPLPTPNLNTSGLIWLGGGLAACLVAVAVARPDDPWEPVGAPPAAVTGVQSGATAVVRQTQPGDGAAVAFWVERGFAMAAHGAVVVGLVLIGVYRFHDTATGAAAGAMYLILPYTAYHVGQIHHVWPAALLVWAVYLFRWPLATGMLVGAAAGTLFFPLFVVPAWVQFYRGKGAGRFAVGLAVAWSLGLLTTIVALAAAGRFPDGFWEALNLADWQPWRVPTADGLWTGAHWAYRLPVFLTFAVFVLGSVAWPAVRNVGHLIAMNAAVLIAIQFWFADQGGLYVLWFSPLLVLVVLRPNLAELVPPTVGPPPAFVTGAALWAWRRVRRSDNPADTATAF